MRCKTITRIAGVAVIAMLTALSAKASLTITLATGNPALSGFSGPYGTVNLTRVNANTLTVELTALGLYSFGDGESVALNLNATGPFTITPISGTIVNGGVWNAGDYSVESAGTADGWGNYNFRLKTFDGFSHSATHLKFTLHATTAAWATDHDVLALNNKGYSVAGHIFTRYANGNDTGITGFAVPEPTTMVAGAMLLLPFGLSTLRVLRRKPTA